MQLAIYDIGNDDNQIDIVSSHDVGKYLDYGDYRINYAAIGYALQILFYYITEGDPFCDDINCRLYNAHWQEELLKSQIQNPGLCDMHSLLLNQFNTNTDA
jgi:hypothetical protein